jgi:uncharacterized protein YegJ (DUF2314 family)
MRTILLTLLAMLAFPAAALAQGDPGSDKIFDIAKGNPAIAAGITRARAELPAFFAKVAAPGPGESYFLVKYDLIPEEAAEFIWAQVTSHADGVTVARLVNNPRDPRFRRGQEVRVPDSAIIDWSYAKDNKTVIGAYTTRALLATMTPAEAAQVRAAHGW